jgi:hypothetical protein
MTSSPIDYPLKQLYKAVGFRRVAREKPRPVQGLPLLSTTKTSSSSPKDNAIQSENGRKAEAPNLVPKFFKYSTNNLYLKL